MDHETDVAAAEGARLDRLPSFDERGRPQAIIESPRGSGNKLKFLPDKRVFAVDHGLPAGLHFPFDFGFVPGTLAPDGDPVDVIVLMDAPAYPGCLVTFRLLGVLEVEQTDPGKAAVRNDRLVGIAEGASGFGDPRSIDDLDSALLAQIETFFQTYNELRGKSFKPLRRRGVEAGRRLIERGEQAAIDQA